MASVASVDSEQPKPLVRLVAIQKDQTQDSLSIPQSLQVEIKLTAHVTSVDSEQPKSLVRMVAIQKDQAQD